MARRKIIAGNWKMNKTPSEAKELVETLKPLVNNPDVDVVYCVPAIDITTVGEAIKGTNVMLGAENMSDQDKGAYTGEISAAMLLDAGVKFVIIGHSERRGYYHEDDAFLNRKVLKAFENGLTPILLLRGVSRAERGWCDPRLDPPSDQVRSAGCDQGAGCFHGHRL